MVGRGTRFFFAILALAGANFSMTTLAESAPDTAGKMSATAAVRSNRLEVTYVIPPGQHIALQKDFFFIEPTAVPGAEFGPTVYPKTEKKDKENNALYTGTVTLSRELLKMPDVKSLTVTAGWQACLDSGSCFPPETVELNAELGTGRSEHGTQKAEITPPSSASSTVTPVSTATPSHNLWYFLLLAFLGGMILNLMPCVLPVLSLKLFSIVKSAHDDARTIRNGALLYTAGVLVSFMVLAGVLIVLKSGGSSVGWGFQMQSPVFVMVLLAVVWVFALSLFDLFMIRAPGMQAAAAASSKTGLAGSFFSGVFAVLLATPCTAPMLAPALGFALAQSAPMILLMFLVVGLGLAFPFLLAGFFPKAARFMPKPGAWMNTFREVMGFALVATAVWLADILHAQLGDKIMGVLWYLLVLAFACWLYGRFANVSLPVRKQWLFTVIALAVAVVGWIGLVDLRAEPEEKTPGTGMQIDKASGWEKFSPARVEELRKEDKAVFIDFGADWCLTCKTNEHGVLYTDEIQAAFRKHGVTPLRGDFTRTDPVISEWLKMYKRAGVPLYLYYAPGAAEPVILPELLTKNMVLELLGK